MKIFLIGDFFSNTGPSIANQILLKGLKENDENILISSAKTKLGRVLEVVYKIFITDVVIFCSFSRIILLGIKIAKIFRKKTFYLMHGYATYESIINKSNTSIKIQQKVNLIERYIFSNVNKVFCVSKKFMYFMREVEPDYKDKFDYIFIGLDVAEIIENANKYKTNKRSNLIISLGGGMRQKNNLIVCKAIDKLIKEKNIDLKYIIIGLPYTDKEEICSYNFVTYYDSLPHNEVIKLLSECYLYIQNSSFETFGMTIIEAIITNCHILISKNVGAIDVIDNLETFNVINNTEDVNEIAMKIDYLLNNNNKSVSLNYKILDNKAAASLLRIKLNN